VFQNKSARACSKVKVAEEIRNDGSHSVKTDDMEHNKTSPIRPSAIHNAIFFWAGLAMRAPDRKNRSYDSNETSKLCVFKIDVLTTVLTVILSVGCSHGQASPEDDEMA
jgi:hypothetical protein